MPRHPAGELLTGKVWHYHSLLVGSANTSKTRSSAARVRAGMRWIGRCVLGFGDIIRGNVNSVGFVNEVNDLVGQWAVVIQVIVCDVRVRLSWSKLTDVDVLGTVAKI